MTHEHVQNILSIQTHVIVTSGTEHRVDEFFRKHTAVRPNTLLAIRHDIGTKFRF